MGPDLTRRPPKCVLIFVRLAAQTLWGTLFGAGLVASCTLSSEGTGADISSSGTTTSSSGTGGGGTTTSTTGPTTTTSTTTSTSSAGGSGGGGSSPCTPGETQGCYTGPPGTEDVGTCVGGTQTCLPDGSAFGDCEGEITPVAEDCALSGDEDCNGSPNDNCPCNPGDTQACYSGPANTQGVGPCIGGMQTCNPDGLGFGACMGEVTPQTEACDGQLVDEDCDGAVNEASGTGCVCDGGATTPCYSGPMGTQNQGVCVGGMQTCNAQGTAQGACVGEVVPSFDSCATSIDEDCDGQAPLCTGSHVFSFAYGTDKDQFANDVATYNTDIYVTGQFTNNLDFGLGTMASGSTSKFDIFLAKFDSAGAVLWQQRFGDGAGKDEIALAMGTDGAGRVAITGSVDGSALFNPAGAPLTVTGAADVFVAVYDAAGNHIFSRLDGDGSGRGVDFDAAANVYLTGDYTGSINFGNGTGNLSSVNASDIFLTKIDIGGVAQWAKSFGGTGNQVSNDLVTDSGGNTFICGRFDTALAFGGAVGNLTSAGAADAFVAKIDAAGNPLWAKSFGDSTQQVAYTLTLDAGGNVYVGGAFQGTVNFGLGNVSANSYDMFVVKLNGTDGSTAWVTTFGGTNIDEVRGISLDALGNVVITGGMQGTIDFGGGALVPGGADDFFVVKLDQQGKYVWAKRAGDGASQKGLGVATDNQSNAITVGTLKGSADFGGGLLTTTVAGTADVFIAKFAQ